MKKKNKGTLITFEGPEGGGKSTQINLFSDFLIKRGYSILITREPGGTQLGNQIRNILLNAAYSDLVDRAELFLFFADRAQHVVKVIKPAIDDGMIVLCDRYIDSTVAYQSGGRGFDRELIDKLNLFSSYNFIPYITFLLDIDPSVGLLRATKDRVDRFEQEKIDFHTIIRDTYLGLAREHHERIIYVNSMGKSIEEIQLEIQNASSYRGI